MARHSEKNRLRDYLPLLLILPLTGLAELASLYSIQALLPKLSEVYNIPLNQVGLVLSAEVGFLAFAMLFSGSLSDRFGRKRVIFYSLVAGGLLTLVCATTSSWHTLVLYRALLGIAVSGITAAVTVYIAEEVSPAMAGIITGYFIFGNSLGSMSGRVFATLMMERVSIETIFLIFGGVLLLMAVVVLAFLPASKNFTATPSLNLGRVLNGGMAHFKNRKISLCFLIGFIIFGSFTSVFNFLAFHLHGAPYNLPYTLIALIPISFSLTFFAAPYAAKSAIRFGSMNTLSFLLTVMVCGALITLVAPSLPVFILGIICLSVAFFSSHSTLLSWVSSHASHAKGQATSFYLLCYYAGGAVIGYLNGYLFANRGWNAVALSIVGLLVVGIALSRLLQASERKTLVSAIS
ncbi:TPA: MFS transporter [Serratia fonticola]